MGWTGSQWASLEESSHKLLDHVGEAQVGLPVPLPVPAGCHPAGLVLTSLRWLTAELTANGPAHQPAPAAPSFLGFPTAGWSNFCHAEQQKLQGNIWVGVTGWSSGLHPGLEKREGYSLRPPLEEVRNLQGSPQSRVLMGEGWAEAHSREHTGDVEGELWFLGSCIPANICADLTPEMLTPARQRRT